MIAGYNLGPVAVRPGLVLSPMSGVTNCAFRRLIKQLNGEHLGLLVSEFISVEGMTRYGRRSLEMMRYHEEERPFCIQIFGYDIDRMRDAAIMVEQAGADIVDINCGCPAPKVVRRGGGCELMRQPDHLQRIFREVRRAVSIPVTMKMRSGWDESSRNALEIARMVEGEGLQGIAVHGRTRAQLYRGEADWSVVERIAESVSIPVMGSGDVVDRGTAFARLQGRIAGLFIGRAAMFNPFVFREIMTGEAVDLRREPERMIDILELYINLLLEELPPQACIGKVKQLASQMCRGVEWRRDLVRAMTLEEQKDLLNRARERLHAGGARGAAGDEPRIEAAADRLRQCA